MVVGTLAGCNRAAGSSRHFVIFRMNGTENQLSHDASSFNVNTFNHLLNGSLIDEGGHTYIHRAEKERKKI